MRGLHNGRRHRESGKIYVGSTSVSFAVRFRQHKTELRGNRHHCKALQNAWNKYGESEFRFVILQPEKNKSIVRDVELHWIHSMWQFNALYNSSKYATTPTKFTDRTIPQSLSEMRKERMSNPEARKHMSDAQKKRMNTPAGKNQIKKARDIYWSRPESHKAVSDRNKNRTEEEIAHLHDIGKKNLGKSDVVFVSPDGERFPNVTSLRKFCAEHGVDRRSMMYLQDGIYSHYNGWTIEGGPDKERFHSDQLRKYYNNGVAVKYNLKSPDGDTFFDIPNLNKFCNEHGLDVGNIRGMFRHKVKSSMGWIAIDDDGGNINKDMRRTENNPSLHRDRKRSVSIEAKEDCVAGVCGL